MFDFLIIIVFIVIAVATSGKKGKVHEEVDLDFQDLASLDDFFKSKAPGRSRASATAPRASKSSPPPIKRSAQFNPPPKKEAARLSHRSADDTFHKSDKAKSSFADATVRQVERPSLISQHYDREQDINARAAAAEAGLAYAQEQVDASAREDFYSLTSKSMFSLKREDLVKSFILSEVMTRYNLNRIYDRIPDFKDD